MTKHSIELRFLASFGLLLVSLTVILLTLLSNRPSGSFREPVSVAALTPETKNPKPVTRKEITPPEKEAPANIELAEPLLRKPSSLAQNPPRQRGPLGAKASSEKNLARISYSDAEELLDRATEFVNKGSPLEAKRLLEEILQSYPDHDTALTELGLIHLLDLKDTAQAQTFLEKAARLNPDNRIALGELVEIYADADPSKGLSFLRNLQEQNPDNPNVSQALGQLLLEDHPEAAAPYLETAVRNGSTSALPELAEAYTAAGNYQKAIEVRQKEDDLAKDKWESGGDEFDREQRITSALNLISLHLEMGNKKQAEEKLAELKSVARNDREYLALLEHFNSSLSR